jgi:hypothetical protein
MKTKFQLLLLWSFTIISFSLIIGTPFPVLADECTVIPNPDYERNCGDKHPEFLTTLEKRQCFIMDVKAISAWNASGIFLKKGVYKFKVIGEEPHWTDGKIETSPKGWSIESLKKENQEDLSWIKKGFIKYTKWLRRAPGENWFHLIGFAASVVRQQFPIGSETTQKLNINGEFCAFANDLHWMYDNNKGSLQIKVVRLE